MDAISGQDGSLPMFFKREGLAASGDGRALESSTVSVPITAVAIRDAVATALNIVSLV